MTENNSHLALETALQKALEGEVRFDAGAKALYATDASNYRHVPIGVVWPKHEADVLRTIDICRAHQAPLLSRGAGTSLAGQTCNAAVIMDFSKHMNHILEIDTTKRIAIVEPGVILDHLRAEAEKYGLTFGPDPATHSRCTLGGMIGNNSCGVHALMAGKTVDNVESLDIVTYDGQRFTVGATSDADYEAIVREGGAREKIYSRLRRLRDVYAERIRARYPRIPRRVSGYNLDELLPEQGFHLARAIVGSEGTCVTVLKATLRLVPSPKSRTLLVLGFANVYDAADAVPPLLRHKPIGLEGMDVGMVMPLKRYQGYDGRISRLPPGEAWLLMEFGGDTLEESQGKARGLVAALQTTTHQPLSHKLCEDKHDTEEIWAIRESALAATAFIPGQRDRLEGWEDTAVPPPKLGAYLRDLRALYNKYGYQGAFYGHFGDGCLHTRIDFDLDTPEGRAKTRRFLDEAADLVVGYGGSLSGEHGDGQARAELLPKMFGPDIVQAFQEFKAIWDPNNRMNPGKIVHPRGILDDLRLADNFQPQKPDTHFHYPDDHGGLVRAVLRCVGVGKCRKEEGGLMCPSYQITRNEKDSTRGRAHLLFEMLKGETITEGWKSEAVKDSLDLCLSCKGCKTECPTNVDMASYKAEFLSHYYKGRLRPRQAYVFGWVMYELRMGSWMPRLANFFTQTPILAALLRWVAGIAPQRQIPPLALETFHALYKKKPLDTGLRRYNVGVTAASPKAPVLLWPDTFTNYLHPEIGQAAVKVLEHFGYTVKLPPTGLCCGRPLYDYGFLPQAKRLLNDILSALRSDIEAGIPVIGLEPSCVAVFRDELMNLFPENPLAKKLQRQTFLLSEFLLQKTTLGSDPKVSKIASGPSNSDTLVSDPKDVLLHTHCHQKSVLTAGADRDLLGHLGFQVHEPEKGCCGMAGSFGFEAGHEKISDALGERALLPAIRQAHSQTLITANGFSCQEQIRQGTGVRPQHIAEIIWHRLKNT